MKPNADLVKAVAQLNRLASEEVVKLTDALSADIVFPDDHQLPEPEDRMNSNNLKSQLLRAEYVTRETLDMLADLLKVTS